MIDDAEKMLKDKNLNNQQRDIIRALIHEVKKNEVFMKEMETKFLGGEKK